MDPRRIRLLRTIATHYAIALGFSFFSSLFYYRYAKASPIVLSLFFALLFGTIFLSLDLSGISRWKHRSFVVTSSVRAIVYGLAIVTGFGIGIGFVVYMGSSFSISNPRLWSRLATVFGSPIVWGSAAMTIFSAFLVSCVIAFSRKLGPGVMARWISGRYHAPRSEERVFMFLDIRDSTTLAETLGDLRFSALVRDFMADLSDPVIAARAEVSHYIGDEAVLVWMPERAFKDDACVRLFTMMREVIARRAPHYAAQYGVIPSFKAGIHFGTAIVTEVGEIKSEIVYHGDTLNTTARIQGLCDTLHYELLISESVADRLIAKGEPVGSHALKGKAEPVVLRGFLPLSLPVEQSVELKV